MYNAVIRLVFAGVLSMIAFILSQVFGVAPENLQLKNDDIKIGELEGASEFATVEKVIDGDTIILSDETRVRYIGIDTPEVGKNKECFGNEATQKNKELVEGKNVRLEKDVEDKDKYGRLLRYVFVDETLVNEVLVMDGFADARSYPPNIKMQKLLNSAEKKARSEGTGMWGVCY